MLFITTFTTSILSSGGAIVGIVVGVGNGEAALVVSGGDTSLDVVGVGGVASVVQ